MILKRNKLTFQCKYNRDDGICQIFPIKKEKIAVKTIEKSANVVASTFPSVSMMQNSVLEISLSPSSVF